MSGKVGGTTPGSRVEREALAIARNKLREEKGLPAKEYTYEHPPASKPAPSHEEKPFIGTPHVRSTRFQRIDEVHPLFRPHLKPNPEDRA